MNPQQYRQHWIYQLLTCILVAAGIAIFYFLCTGIGEYIARKL